MPAASTVCASARSAMLGGELDRARDLLDEALPGTTDPAERAQVLGLRIRVSILLGDGAALLPVVEEAAADCEAVDPVTAGNLLLDAVVLKLYIGQFEALELAERAHLLTRGGDEFARAKADTILGISCLYAEDNARALGLVLRSADLLRLGGPPDEVTFLLQCVVFALSSLERYDEALVICRRYVRAMRSIGADGLLPLTLCFLVNTQFFVSDFAELEMGAAEAITLAESLRQPGMAAYARLFHALAVGLRGDDELAVSQLEELAPRLGEVGMETMHPPAEMALGLLEMGRGRWQAAAGHHARIRAVLPMNSGVLHWRADEVETLWRCGRESDARSALDELAALAPSLGPWERGATARVSALLGPEADAEAHFAEALRWHRQSPSRFERARTELCWGEWLMARGRPREASPHLEAARVSFAELDTPVWRRRAEELLGRPAISVTQSHSDNIAVRAFGPLTVVRDGVETQVALDHPGRLMRCVVAAGGAVHVEQAIDRLWPGATVASGSTRLRNVLTRVRSGYGPVLVRQGQTLRLAEDADVDVRRFRELIRRAAALGRGEEAAELAQAAVDLYRDDLLPLERYDDEVIAARERARRAYLDMLDLLAEHECTRGRPDAAARHLRAAINNEPLDEIRYVRLAALLLDEGHSGQARSVLAEARRACAELDLEVSPQLAALEQRLSGGTPLVRP